MSRTHWNTVPISQLYEGLYDGPHATPTPADEGPIFLGIKNVTDDGHLDLSEIRHIAEEDFAAWTRRIEPRPGDLVFTYEATLNRYAIIPQGFRGCLGRRMALIRTNPERVDARYLHFYFFTPAWRDVVHQHTLSGATVDRLPLTRFPEFPVCIPPLPEQRRIAGILSAYDDLIENCERRIRVLDEMARALYREWFVLFRYPGHGGQAMAGSLPKGWQRVPVKQVYESLYDGPHATPAPSNEGPVFLGIGNITERGRLDLSAVRHISEEDFPRWTKRAAPQPGDIVFTYEATLHRYAMIPDGFRGCLGRRLALIRVDPAKKCGRFLFYTLLSDAWRHVVSSNILSGATVDRIPLTGLPDFPINLPPAHLVAQFDDVVRPLVEQQNCLNARNVSLRRTRDLLLPRLLSGELNLEAPA